MLSLCVTFMVYKKQPQPRKSLLYYLVLNRNNCVVKLFILCLLLLGKLSRHEDPKYILVPFFVCFLS